MIGTNQQKSFLTDMKITLKTKTCLHSLPVPNWSVSIYFSRSQRYFETKKKRIFWTWSVKYSVSECCVFVCMFSHITSRQTYIRENVLQGYTIDAISTFGGLYSGMALNGSVGHNVDPWKCISTNY